MKTKYVYVPCDAGGNVNNEFRMYLRLYKHTDEGQILVEQGLSDLIPGWEKKYDATLQIENPYPTLD